MKAKEANLNQLRWITKDKIINEPFYPHHTDPSAFLLNNNRSAVLETREISILQKYNALKN